MDTRKDKEDGRDKHRSSSHRSESGGSSHHHRQYSDEKSRSGSSASKSHDRDREDDRETRDKKRHKSSSSSSKSSHHDRHKHHREKERSSHRKREHKDRSPEIKDGSDHEEEDDDDVWIEKHVPGVAPLPAPSALALEQKSSAIEPSAGSTTATESEQPEEPKSLRDSWMTEAGGLDFGLMGALRVKKPKEERPDPEKLHVSSRELNVHLVAGLHVDQYPTQEKPSYTIGDAGSNWRMTKLKRVMETAAEEGVPLEMIGLERYGSIEKYREALAEREELDRRAGKRRPGGRGSSSSNGSSPSSSSADRPQNNRRDDGRDDRYRDGDKNRDRDRERDRDSRDSLRDKRSSSSRREDDHSGSQSGNSPLYKSTTSGRFSASSSVSSSPFHRPMEDHERQEKELARQKLDKERERQYTPIPSPFASHVSSPLLLPNQLPQQPTIQAAAAILTPDQLNKLKARSIRARMMGMPDADELEKEYESAKAAAANPPPAPTIPAASSASASSQRVVVVQGMMNRAGSGSGSPSPLGPGNGRTASGKIDKSQPTHDEQGHRLFYQGEERDLDLAELVRREKLNQDESMDKEFARRITRDAVFNNDLDYMDDNADKIARTVKRTDQQIKTAAISDYRRNQSALDGCQLCFKQEGTIPPQMAVVSMGTRAYLGLPLFKEFSAGHCMIVPIQHVTSTLECDDDCWDEIRNFMKCLIQMHAANDHGVIFSETVMNLKYQKHTMIECIPIPWEASQAAPGYFKEAILASDEEWSQHKKLIETNTATNGGFRRRLTPKLPFFHVWFGSPDRGYGHVIEDENRFQSFFVKQVLASVCEMDAMQWVRAPKKHDYYPREQNRARVEYFKKTWTPWDWTRVLDEQEKKSKSTSS